MGIILLLLGGVAAFVALAVAVVASRAVRSLAQHGRD
jgi:hypothetical protein